MATGTYEVYAPIVKTEKTEDGDLIVWGKATGPDLDLDQQICDPGWLAKAMPAWFEWGNVRAQHSNVAAGVGLEMESTDSGDYYVKALIVDKDSIDKVNKKVYKGYSIGITNGRLAKDKAAPNGRIVAGDIPELSLVDRPCNPTAKMSIAKAYGGHMAPVDAEGEVDVEATATTATKIAIPVGVLTELRSDEDSDPADLEPAIVETAAPKAASAKRPAAILTPRAHKSALALVGKVLAGEQGESGLLLKAAGSNDESSDIAGAWTAIGQIADLIISEATELKTGRMEEVYDIRTLLDAVCALKWFIYSETEQDGKASGPFQPDSVGEVNYETVLGDDGVGVEVDYIALAAAADEVKAAAPEIEKGAPVEETPIAAEVPTEVAADPTVDMEKTVWTQEKRDAARKAGHTLSSSDDSYPIEDASDVKDAVHLVGNGTASKKKIRRHIMAQAARVGAMDQIPDAWKTDAATDDSKAAEPEITKVVDMSTTLTETEPTAAFDKSAVAEIVTKAVTEAVTASEDRLKAVEAELAKVLAMPRPGGPMILTPPQTPSAPVTAKSAEVARLLREAEKTNDPGIASAWRARARQVESAEG